jgi:pilus assembly protein Flp/PilA
MDRGGLTSSTAQRDRESGASLVEYALLIALIAIVCFIAVQYMGNSTAGGFSTFNSSFSDATN